MSNRATRAASRVGAQGMHVLPRVIVRCLLCHRWARIVVLGKPYCLENHESRKRRRFQRVRQEPK